VERLNAAVRKALDDPAIKETLLARGTVTVAGTPDDLARFVTSENARWGKVVKQIGAQVD